MRWNHKSAAWLLVITLGLLLGQCVGNAATNATPFPPPLDSYGDAHLTGLWAVLKHRIEQNPLNLWATLLFLAAVTHTFLCHKFLAWSHALEARGAGGSEGSLETRAGHSRAPARALHFLGEVEAVFGLWVIPLVAVLSWKIGWHQTLEYLNHGVSFNEALFVVAIMAIASTKPVLALAEKCLRQVARLVGGGPGAWWLAILTLGPVLGSLITEPAAMTISALLLSSQFYVRNPSPPLAYATLGLLFVNVSVGGVLTHFAAPPVLMVAGTWNWNTAFMFRHFGWIALVGIALGNSLYYLLFRREMARLNGAQAAATAADSKNETGAGTASSPRTEICPPRRGDEAVPAPVLNRPRAATNTTEEPIPFWVTLGHLGFMAWMVWNVHYPALVIGGFLFFLAFFEVTADYQAELQMRAPILVGFFLAGLVIHGGLQQWWIAPVLGRLREVPLMIGAIGLTAFNDNAAISYLSTLVPNLSQAMKSAVLAGAVVGGGLTVIANAPNPAGQSILGRHFKNGIAPLGLLLGALPATVIMAVCFLLLR